jgi:serine protease
MKKQLGLFFLLCISVFTFGQTVNPDYADGMLYVKLQHYHTQDGGGIVPLPNLTIDNMPFNISNPKKYGIRSFHKAFHGDNGPKLNATMLLEFTSIQNIDDLINEIKHSPAVEYVEKVPMVKPILTPNDPRFPSMWHLQKIEAAAAWNFFSGGSNIVIAIVDDAIQRSHPDLAPNMWVNPGEIPGNGIDDDGNGFVDDVYGWDFSTNTGNIEPPSDDMGHGTHVAGIASAATDNGIGIASIGFSAKIMGIKSSNTAGSWPSSNSYNGILYAANNGANVINMSWGGAPFSTTHQNVIDQAIAKGCILVGAAGNDNSDEVLYPAGYGGVISVASSDLNDKRSTFSNYGDWVKITAPGSSIESTYPTNRYATTSGTSMASPMVAGLIALMKSLNPAMPNSELIQCLYSSADNIDAENPIFVGRLGAGRINARRAMECVNATLTSPPVANFVATNQTISAGSSTSFNDRSAYAPTAWSWSFPGGIPATSNVQNPTNILYNTPGTYPVTLTASNQFGSNTITKTEYITVGPPISCLRINIPPPENWTPTSYSFGSGNGFLNGTNINADRQRAMYFDASGSNSTTLTGFAMILTHATATNPEKYVTFRVFDGTSGTPGTLLGSVVKTMAELKEDVDNEDITIIDFPDNVTIPASRKFFISADFTNLTWTPAIKDSFNIVSTQIGQGSNDVWSQNAVGDWISYQTAFGVSNLSLYIFPFLTATPTKAVISPINPVICSGNGVAFTAENSLMPPNQPMQWVLLGTNPQVINDEVAINPIYNTPGTYKAYFAVLGACNEIRIDSTVVTVNQSPALDISASKNPICQGETSTLTASGATSYSWSPETGLNASTGNTVLANPTSTTSYILTGTTGACNSSLSFELVVTGNSANVQLNASDVEISQPTTVTFTAIPTNGGSAPTYNFLVNSTSVQNGPQNFLTRLVNVGDRIQCTMTSNEACVVEKTVSSIEIIMGQPLPVTLLRFSGRRTPAGNLLEWATGTEINSKEFILERSGDGASFAAIDRVNAAGNSAVQNNYSLLDGKYGIGKNFYRLKMIDLDGSFKYSRIVMIENGPGILTTTLAPNPARTGTSSLLTINGIDRDSRISVSIINAAGAILRTYQQQSFNGTIQVSLSANNLPSGSYMILVRDAAGNINETIRWNVIR